MGIEPFEESDEVKRQISRPRPGHADLVGGMKYGHRDLRNVLERSSARETTVRVAAGSVAKKLLKLLGIEVVGHVLEIGGIKSENGTYESIDQLRTVTEESPVRCLDEEAGKKMMDLIDEAKKNGDSIGASWKSSSKACLQVSEAMCITTGSWMRKLQGQS